MAKKREGPKPRGSPKAPAGPRKRRAATKDAFTPSLQLLREANERLVLTTLAAETARTAAEEDRRALEHEAELRERLLEIVGHDLQNPMASILMATEALSLGGSVPANVVPMLAGISESALRVRELMDQLLRITRLLHADELSVTRQPMDLEQACRAVIGEVERAHRASGRFACSFKGPMTGSWDPARMAQAISNLATNAVQHGAKDAKVRVDVRGADSTVELAVSNSGAFDLPDVAEPGAVPFRRPPHRRGKGSGRTGLGLYIAGAVARAHGGRLSVDRSVPGTVRVTLTLPRGELPPGDRRRLS